MSDSLVFTELRADAVILLYTTLTGYALTQKHCYTTTLTDELRAEALTTSHTHTGYELTGVVHS